MFLSSRFSRKWLTGTKDPDEISNVVILQKKEPPDFNIL